MTQPASPAPANEENAKLIKLPQVYRPRRDDQEFLPSALSILETPASPVGLALILLLGAFVVLTFMWGWFGKMDIIATAQGKIRPQGGVKIIQPLDPGNVSQIYVKNGDHVEAGQTLIRLDPSILEADEKAAVASLGAAQAEIARRRTALDLVAQTSDPQLLKQVPLIEWEAAIPATNRAREQRVLLNDLTQLAVNLSEIDSQILQKKAEQQGLDGTIRAENDLIVTLQQRVDMRKSLVKSGSGTKSSLIDGQETLKTQQTTLAGQEAQLLLSKASIVVLQQDRDKTIASFNADYANKLAEAQKLGDDNAQKLAAAKMRVDRMTLVSPIEGTVLGLSVTTIGQVVMSGQEVMRIVPENPHLEIESYLSNTDAGFVKVGQTAILKVEAFPFTRYGTLKGIVTHVAQDAIPEADALQAQANATASAETSLFPTAQPTQNLVFAVDIKLEQSEIRADGKMVPLTPGMTVTAEVNTGKRRILEYFFSPLIEVTSRALKER